MTRIPGIAYLIIGILTTGISYFINNKTQTNSLTLFMFIGGIFIIIGLIKLAIREKPKTVHHKAAHQQTNQPHQHAPSQRQHHPSQNIQQQRAPIRTTEKTAAENAPSDFISINPKNRVEQYILEQEVREEKVTPHPAVITCPHCKRRQYKIREHCFVCNHKI